MTQVDVSPSVLSNTKEGAALSLLSLSIAAASASPIPVDSTTRSPQGNTTGPKHRRLSSTGKTRRRLSEARDAAIRPTQASVQTAAAALSSLATLSLSSSPPTLPAQPSSFTTASQLLTTHVPILIPTSQSVNVGSIEDEDGESSPSSLPNNLSISLETAQGTTSASVGTSQSLTKTGKKRGTIFTCESCSKVYRHPSCLIKHRWEHTPQWREASKFVLSKHQQVQLLEAAAILSHLSPSSGTGTSLPEDRSLWPAFLSGGRLPGPAPAPNDASSSTHILHPVSSSVPATSSRAPRLHDYAIPIGSPGGITQLRPGLLGVPNASSGSPINTVTISGAGSAPSANGTMPVAVPSQTRVYGASTGGGRESWDSYRVSSYAPSEGWSVPRSSVRSVSVSLSSRSRSASESKSDDEEEGEMVDIDVDIDASHAKMRDVRNTRDRRLRGRAWKVEEEEFSVVEEDEDDMISVKGREREQSWDGMEMEMEMD